MLLGMISLILFDKESFWFLNFLSWWLVLILLNWIGFGMVFLIWLIKFKWVVRLLLKRLLVNFFGDSLLFFFKLLKIVDFILDWNWKLFVLKDLVIFWVVFFSFLIDFLGEILGVIVRRLFEK